MTQFFEGLHATLLTVPLGTSIMVKMPSDLHPRDFGAVLSVGLDKGQLEDWRFPPDDAGQGMHLHKYRDHWTAHLDRHHPEANILEHLRYDAPGMYMGLMGAAGALVGFLVAPKDKRLEYAWGGAFVGTMAGAATRRTNDEDFTPIPTKPTYLLAERAEPPPDGAGTPRKVAGRGAARGLDWEPYG